MWDRKGRTHFPALLFQRGNNGEVQRSLVELIAKVLRKLNAPVVRVGQKHKLRRLLVDGRGCGSGKRDLLFHRTHRFLAQSRSHDGDHWWVERARDAEIRHCER